MTSEYVLKTKALRFDINGVEILKGIDLEVGKGEFIGLIGPNGAGKTTLLKCLNGIYKGSGFIEIKGMKPEEKNSRSIAGEIALMHQSTSITFPFPAIDIVLAGRYPHQGRFRRESGEDYGKARSFMEYTDTLKFERVPINNLSGGERQRVLFAKVLAQETDIILLDEPAASLDIAHEEQIFKYSVELCRSGRTVIAAVHDLKTAIRYCSRLVLMNGGCIIADGSPETVLTSDNLSKAYGVNALVYRNRITGQLDFHIHGMEKGKLLETIHVIGGGGSASGVVRQLFENGCSVTAGVFSHGDSDLSCAEVFGIKCLVCRPFSEIDEENLAANIKMVKNADLTILCDMPFGMQNLKNLEAARHARKLVLIEDGEPAGRDFTGGMALEIYGELRKRAVIVSSAKLHEVIG